MSRTMTIIRGTIVGAVLAFVASAYAQGAPLATQCATDTARYCAKLEHGGGAARACVGARISDVARDCRPALETTDGGLRVAQSKTAMKTSDIVAKLEGMGYKDIREIESKGDRYEVKATDKDGHPVELYVDAFTGDVLRSKRIK